MRFLMKKLDKFRSTRGILGSGAKVISGILMKIIKRVLGCKGKNWGFKKLTKLTNAFFMLYSTSKIRLLTPQCRKAPKKIQLEFKNTTNPKPTKWPKKSNRGPGFSKSKTSKKSKRGPGFSKSKKSKKSKRGPRFSKSNKSKKSKKSKRGPRFRFSKSKKSLEARVKKLEKNAANMKKVFSSLKDSNQEQLFTEADLDELHKQAQIEGLTDDDITALDKQAWAEQFDTDVDMDMSTEVNWGGGAAC
jgi:hypothetical protein